MQLRLADGTRLTATTRDGYYLLPAVPRSQLTCATVVGIDPRGRQVGPAQYLTMGCPGDPAQVGSPAPHPGPGATVTEDEPKQAVAYDDYVDVGVDTVIKQNPDRGLGSSAPGMSLITVRLQFFRQPAQPPPALPTSVSFDLLYGPDHRVATVDPGKHNDPDLSGVWTPPYSDGSDWLPQLSFDVPTDQLATLQVRLNGDASHGTILFRAVPVEN